MEERYKRSMMTNAQLDNEKQAFRYQVDLLKDQVEEMEEHLIDTQRELKDRVRVRSSACCTVFKTIKLSELGLFLKI